MCRHMSRHGIVWIQGHCQSGLMMQKLAFFFIGACTVCPHMAASGFGHSGASNENLITSIIWQKILSQDSLIKSSHHNSPPNTLMRTNGRKSFRRVVPSKRYMFFFHSQLPFARQLVGKTEFFSFFCVHSVSLWLDMLCWPANITMDMHFGRQSIHSAGILWMWDHIVIWSVNWRMRFGQIQHSNSASIIRFSNGSIQCAWVIDEVVFKRNHLYTIKWVRQPYRLHSNIRDGDRYAIVEWLMQSNETFHKFIQRHLHFQQKNCLQIQKREKNTAKYTVICVTVLGNARNERTDKYV